MDLLIAFILTLSLITVVSIWYRISPFFTLIGGAILFGLMAGFSLNATFLAIISGIGNIFGMFGIIILSGAIIAKLLQEQHQTEEIIADIRHFVKNPPVIAGFSGYFLSVPVTCSITTYIMLQPILERLGKDAVQRNVLLYLAAAGSIVSYTLIYPTPAVIPLFSTFADGLSPAEFDIIAIPLSLAVLALVILFFRWARPDAVRFHEIIPCDTPLISVGDATRRHHGFHWRAWAPFIAILTAIPVALFIFNLSHEVMIQFIMLAGAVTAIALAPAEQRAAGLSSAAKHAGLIIFDICGAGALGIVIVKSGFAQGTLAGLMLLVPVILVPFILAAVIETAQGSRVVTAVITSQVLAGTQVVSTIHPVPLILLISAGACIISYVTDPYFWLVQRTTGDDIRTVVLNYTLPVALAGLVVFAVAVMLEFFVY